MVIDFIEARREQWRMWFDQVWARIEEERGYPCERTFEEFCEGVDNRDPKTIEFLATLRLEQRGDNR